MKIKVGGSLGMTLTNIPYSPIKVETTLVVEKQMADNLSEEELNSTIEELNSKVEKIMYKDIDTKMVAMAKKQKELRKKLENL